MLGLFKDDAFFQPLFKLQFCIENTILFIITMVVPLLAIVVQEKSTSMFTSWF